MIIHYFFKDLLTLSEVVMISRRLQIAKMLLVGLEYGEIKEKLRVGLGTIYQVEKWLKRGFGGYQPIIERHNKTAKFKIRGMKIGEHNTPYTFSWLKKKYPVHFLLFNLYDKIKEK
mgnify:FL=1